MKNKVNCAIIKDLLPSYVDGLTSEETNQAVKEHTKNCPQCMEVLRSMTVPENWAEPKNTEEEMNTAEIDYLKKVRKTGRRKIWIIAVVCLLIGFTSLFISTFYIGKESSGADLAYEATVTENTLTLDLMVTGSAMGIPRYQIRKADGVLYIRVYSALTSFLSKGNLTITQPLDEDIHQIRLGNLILWEDGQLIDKTTARLYAARNPYVGDASANANLAAILQVNSHMEGMTTHLLQTSTEPYGWTIKVSLTPSTNTESFYDYWSDGETIRYKSMDMLPDSCALLATVENLGYVTWQYETASGRQEYTVTLEDACAITGMDVKACYDSITELQKLMDICKKIRQNLWHDEMLQ